MNRDAFLTELSGRLERLPAKERMQIMDYYREYTAYIEREGKDIVETIGTPNDVACNAVANAAMSDMSNTTGKAKDRIGGFGLAIFSLFALPIGLPLAIAMTVVIIALFIALLSVVLSVSIAALAVIIAGVASLVVAIILATSNPMTGVFFGGAGLFMIGFGNLLKLIVKPLWNGAFSLLGGLFSRIFSGRPS